MRLHKIISQAKPELRQIGEYNVLIANDARMLKHYDPVRFDAIVVNKESIISEILCDDNLYLKPLFVKSPTFKTHDGVYDEFQISACTHKIQLINQAAKPFFDLQLPSDSDLRLFTKLSRYAFSRQISIAPKNSRSSKIGYVYPLVEDMSLEKDTLHILKSLENYTSQNLLSKKIEDKVNVCYECQSSYLNFSECCTKCNSIDLKSEELIHHFRCAYVGPQSDFEKEDGMCCPKCDHKLKHIGIDYDKPSEVHTCKSCNHSSQETKMKAKCVDCTKENELDQLTTFEISNYHLTEKSKKLALASNEKDQLKGNSVPDNQEIIVPLLSYNLIKAHEARKNSKSSTTSAEMVVQIQNYLTQNLNEQMKTALVHELSAIIHPYLQSNDLITIESETIKLLLVEYSFSQADELKDILDYNLNKMIMDNGLSGEKGIKITVQNIK